MSTGNFENWAGEISEIGAIYPFVGSETALVIVGVLFWIWWHVKQVSIEKKELEEATEMLQDSELLRRAVKED